MQHLIKLPDVAISLPKIRPGEIWTVLGEGTEPDVKVHIEVESNGTLYFRYDSGKWRHNPLKYGLSGIFERGLT